MNTLGASWWIDAGVWLLRTSVQATVVLAIVLIVRSAFRRVIAPRWTYLLWLLVIARLVLPVTPASPFSVFNIGKALVRDATELLPIATAQAAPASVLRRERFEREAFEVALHPMSRADVTGATTGVTRTHSTAGDFSRGDLTSVSAGDLATLTSVGAMREIVSSGEAALPPAGAQPPGLASPAAMSRTLVVTTEGGPA